MANTIYATFPTEQAAERAAGALMDHGISSADVSFIVPERLGPARTEFAGGYIPTGPDSSTPANAPASHHPVPPPADTPQPDLAAPGGISTLNQPTVVVGQPGAVVNPPAAMRPRPGYIIDSTGAEVPDPNVVSLADRPGTVQHTTPTGTAVLSGSTVPGTGSTRTTMASDTPSDVVDADHGHIIDNTRAEPSAAGGITTTTGKDAAKGAAEGAGIGLGLGLVLGLAAVAIPGIGLVAGAGALVAGLTAATAAAGGVAGGVFGYLSDMGVSAEYVRRLDSHLKAGGTILSVTVTGAIPQGEIVMLLEKYGATSAEAF
jgi:hypothetical protein